MRLGQAAAVFMAIGALLGSGCQLLAGVHDDAVEGVVGAGGAGGGCAADGDCDDRNPCTNDACVAGACSHMANNKDPDDRNDCTDDSCSGGVATHAPATAGKKCRFGGNSLLCDGSGNCHGCKSNTDCQSPNDCATWSCDLVSTNCVSTPAPAGKAPTDKNPGDCHVSFCDGSGGAVDSTLPAGTPCSSGGKVCDVTGRCVECLTSADCASKVCRSGACLLDVGAACGDAVLCATDLCPQGKCAACIANANCQSGKCNQATGHCLAKSGEPCAAGADCAGGSCIGGLCRLPVGGQCGQDSDCVTEHCAAGSCAPCAVAADCPSGSCATVMTMSGVCKLPSGSYCADGSQCAGFICTGSPARCM